MINSNLLSDKDLFGIAHYHEYLFTLNYHFSWGEYFFITDRKIGLDFLSFVEYILVIDCADINSNVKTRFLNIDQIQKILLLY